MPRNETVEMDLTLTLNATATVIYGAKGLVEDVFITEDATIERAYLDGAEVDGAAQGHVDIQPSTRISTAIKEMLNDQIVSSRT
jgi:hypothetical protein